jgi:hypothetical protein
MSKKPKIESSPNSTAQELAYRILADREMAAKGLVPLFPDPQDQPEALMMQTLMPNGKRLGECTREELKIIAEAHDIVAKHASGIEAALRWLARLTPTVRS